MYKQCQLVDAKSKNYSAEKNKRFRYQSRRFWSERNKKRPLVPSPKKRFNLLKNCDLKTWNIKDFAEAMNKVFPQSILHSAVPKLKVNFFRELISTKNVQPKKVLSISDFKKNLSVFTKENIETIEKLTMVQSENEHWFKIANV